MTQILIGLANDYSFKKFLLTFTTSVLLASLAQAQTEVYFANQDIEKLEIDSLNRSTLVNSMGIITDIHIDKDRQKIYWSDDSAMSIFQADLDGSNQQTILGSLMGVDSIALDMENGKIYFIAFVGGDFNIRRVNLDGTNDEVIVTNHLGVRDMFYDRSRNQLFFTSQVSVDIDIFYVDLSGSFPTSPIPLTTFSAIGPAAGMSMDPNGEHMVFSDTNQIIDLDMNSLMFMTIYTTADNIRDTIYDPSQDLVYFTEQSADFSNTSIKSIPNTIGPVVTHLMSPSPDSFDELALLTRKPVTPDTVLDDQPAVEIGAPGKPDNSAFVVAEDFDFSDRNSDGVEDNRTSFRYVFILRGTRTDIASFSHLDPDLAKRRRRVRRRKVTKRNRVTFKRIRPGNYRSRYRVQITRKRNNETVVVAKTNFSPANDFSL